MLHDIKIKSPGHPSSASLEIDGQSVTNAHAVKFEITPGSWASAEIRIIPNTFDFEGNADVTLDAQTAELLVKLGWTPPTDQ